MLGPRPPGLEFRILCLEDSVISFISPSSGGSPGLVKPMYVHKGGGLKPDSFHFSVNSQPIFMQFCKDFTIFAAPPHTVKFSLENVVGPIVQKLDHLACSVIQGLCLQRDTNGHY